MLGLVVALQVRFWALVARRDERGQAAVEYALVLLGVASVALLVLRWATRTDLVGRLFDVVFNTLLGRVR